MEVTLPASRPDLVLDWRPSQGARLRQLRVNGKSAQTRIEQEHLIVPARFLRAGKNRVTFAFEAPIAPSGSAVTRYLDREDGSEYVYTLFVPSDASSVFPCFDQPDLKARFTLALTLPRAWTAVGNAPVAAVEDAPNDARRFRFIETLPISTYLFAFAAGPFAEIRDTASPPASIRERARGRQAGKGPSISTAKTESVETKLFVRKSRLESRDRQSGVPHDAEGQSERRAAHVGDPFARACFPAMGSAFRQLWRGPGRKRCSRLAQHAHHAQRHFAPAIVPRDVSRLVEAERLVEAARAGVGRAQLEVNRSDPGDVGRFGEPLDHAPPDTQSLMGGAHRQKVQVGMLVTEKHDGKSDDAVAIAGEQRERVLVCDRARNALGSP